MNWNIKTFPLISLHDSWRSSRLFWSIHTPSTPSSKLDLGSYSGIAASLLSWLLVKTEMPAETFKRSIQTRIEKCFKGEKKAQTYQDKVQNKNTFLSHKFIVLKSKFSSVQFFFLPFSLLGWAGYSHCRIIIGLLEGRRRGLSDRPRFVFFPSTSSWKTVVVPLPFQFLTMSSEPSFRSFRNLLRRFLCQ